MTIEINQTRMRKNRKSVVLFGVHEKYSALKHATATNLIWGKKTNGVDKHRLGLSRVTAGL